jgi:hypothetical protein
MTRAEKIAAARRALKFAREFRAGIEELTEGPAKPEMLARADAVIAIGELILARLEHASAPLSASLPQPAGVQ